MGDKKITVNYNPWELEQLEYVKKNLEEAYNEEFTNSEIIRFSLLVLYNKLHGIELLIESNKTDT